MGFASMDNKPDYPNSDQSIQPLMDIYDKAESAPDQPQTPAAVEDLQPITPLYEYTESDTSTIAETKENIEDNSTLYNQSDSLDNSDIGKFITKEDLINASEFHRVYIFCDKDESGNICGLNSQNFQAETANSLLKIIEEPQSGVTFIFLTRYIDDLLSKSSP